MKKTNKYKALEKCPREHCKGNLMYDEDGMKCLLCSRIAE